MTREKTDFWVGLFIMLGLVALAFLALRAGNMSSFSFTPTYRVQAHFDNVGGLKIRAPVKSSGVVVGRVAAIGFDNQRFQATVALAERWGKRPVVAQDTPGFIVNRVARPFYLEALRLLGDGVADVATIDRLVRSAGFRMGPFELLDLIGLDVNLAVTQSVYDATFGEPRFRPHPIQARLVAAGRLGRKTGGGFYPG